MNQFGCTGPGCPKCEAAQRRAAVIAEKSSSQLPTDQQPIQQEPSRLMLSFDSLWQPPGKPASARHAVCTPPAGENISRTGIIRGFSDI